MGWSCWKLQSKTLYEQESRDVPGAQRKLDSSVYSLLLVCLGSPQGEPHFGSPPSNLFLPQFEVAGSSSPLWLPFSPKATHPNLILLALEVSIILMPSQGQLQDLTGSFKYPGVFQTVPSPTRGSQEPFIFKEKAASCCMKQRKQ